MLLTGRLKMKEGNMLPENEYGDCKKLFSGDYCQLAGNIIKLEKTERQSRLCNPDTQSTLDTKHRAKTSKTNTQH